MTEAIPSRARMIAVTGGCAWGPRPPLRSRLLRQLGHDRTVFVRGQPIRVVDGGFEGKLNRRVRVHLPGRGSRPRITSRSRLNGSAGRACQKRR